MILPKNKRTAYKKNIRRQVLKKIKTFFSFLLMTIMLFSLSGCWDSIDVNEKSLLVSVGVDRKGKQHIFYAEIANLISEEDSSTDKFTLVKSTGDSFIDVRHEEDIKFDKLQYLGATKILILTADLTKSGMADYMYRQRRLPDYRKTLKIVTTFDKVENLFNVELKKDLSLGIAIDDMIKLLIDNGQIVEYDTSQILEYLSSYHVCFLLPCINIKDNENAFTGYSIIQKGYYKGYIPIAHSKGLLCFLNDQAKLMYNVPFEDKIAIVEVKLKRRNIIPFYNNKTIRFNTHFVFESQVQYLNVNEGLDDKAIMEVAKNLKALLMQDLNYAIAQSQNIFKGDYLGFYNAFRISYPNEIKEMDWYEEYLSTKIKITVETSLNPGGALDYDPPKN